MVVKRISRRRKKSSSPRRKSRRKSKQKKRSRVRRRSKNKLEGGTSGRSAAARRAKTAIGAVARVPGKIISALGDVRDKNKTALLEDWKENVNSEVFESYVTGDDAIKKMLAAARKWKQAQTVDEVKKVGRKIRGKTYVLLVKKNEEEGSTCVYKPKDTSMTFEVLQKILVDKGAFPIADIVSSTPVTNEDLVVFNKSLANPNPNILRADYSVKP